MPNWVDNIVTISGDIGQMDLFLEKCKGSYNGESRVFMFGSLLTIPASIEAAGPEAVVNHIKEQWGTTKEAFWSHVVFKRKSGRKQRYAIRFATAWTCAMQAMISISEMFPKLRFDIKWIEEDSNYGRHSIRNGRIIQCMDGRYKHRGDKRGIKTYGKNYYRLD